MAEEENKNQESEETPDAPAGEAEDAAPEEAPAEDAAEAAAPEDAPAEEAPAEEPAAEAPSEDAPAADAASADDAMEGLDWKARARLERSRQSGEPGPQRSPEERAAERAERRREASRRRRAYRPRGRRRRKGSGEGTAPADRDSVAPKTRQGTVVSNKADKTITVRIDIVRRHPAYEKIVRRSSKLHAHDERNEANEGDVVRVVETRPLSRTKRWRLAEILEKAK